MRSYSRINSNFWTGETGKSIRKLGYECQIIAMYVLTSPHANMIGLYHLPVAYISADTGIPFEGASKGLRSLYEGGFLAYDESSEVVWVYEMARFQVGEKLKANDNRVAAIQKEFDNVPKNMHLSGFYDRYGEVFSLQKTRGFEGASKGLERDSKDPSKPAISYQLSAISQQLSVSPPLSPIRETEKPKRKTRKPRERDAIFDAVAEADGYLPGAKLPPKEGGRIGNIANDMKAKGATPSEIAKRWKWIITEYPTATTNALKTHWDAAGRGTKGFDINDVVPFAEPTEEDWEYLSRD